MNFSINFYELVDVRLMSIHIITIIYFYDILKNKKIVHKIIYILYTFKVQSSFRSTVFTISIIIKSR